MQIQTTKEGGVIIYDQNDWLYGLASGYGTSSTINYQKLGKGAEYLKAINPYLFPGILCPGLLGTVLTDNTNIVTAISNGVVERTSTIAKAWLIEAGTKIHQIALNSPYIISTTTPFPYTIFNSIFTHYKFTVSSASATVGATYTNNGKTFTVTATISGATTLETSGTGAAAASGTLTKATGTGDATITFSAVAEHSTPVGSDIITFNISGTEYVLYSYNDTTDGDVGRVGIAPSNDDAFDDGWFSTNAPGSLNKSVPHPMIVGGNQKLYIADLASSGTLSKLWIISDTGTITSSTTIVPRNYVIKGFTKTNDRLVIFANKIKGASATTADRGESIALFWDYSASSADYIYSLNDNEVTAGFNWNGIVGCFTTGRVNEFANVGYTSKLQIFEGGRFIPIFNFSQESPLFGGIDIVNNMLIWNSGGVVYSYGSPYPDYPKVVNKITQCAGTTNGFLKALNGLEIYASTGATTSNEVFKQAATYYATSAWRGIVAEPLFPPHTQGKVDYVEVGFYGSATGGRNFTLYLDFDYGTSKTVLDAVSTITAGTQILYRSHDSSGASYPPFSAIKPKVSWAAGNGSGAAPKISYIKIFYKLVNIKF